MQKMGNEGILCRRMKFPAKGAKNLPFHFFNVLASKLSSTQVCECAHLNLLAVMELNRNVQCC